MVVALLSSASAALAAPPGSSAPPVITFNGSVVQIASVTPKGTVFVYGIAMEPTGWMNAIVRRATYLTDSGGGAVSWTIDKPVPVRSVWFAVDLTSGMAATAYPDGFSAASLSLGDANLRKGLSGDIEELAMSGYAVDFAVVRPGRGAWARYVHWDASNELPNERGTPHLKVLDLLPVAGTKDSPPPAMKPGDVVLMTTFAMTTRYAITVVK
ncbi:MAG TPA: hypothetical protein VGR95_04720 [Thermoanaerobaculia bacterium]|nr:hypothetical protein [Thermoanaerobaculia bacterium]